MLAKFEGEFGYEKAGVEVECRRFKKMDGEMSVEEAKRPMLLKLLQLVLWYE